MAGNQGDQSQGGGQQSKTKMCYACDPPKATGGEKRCDDCGNFRFVVCPHCNAKDMPNTAKCGTCGGDLASMKIGDSTKPATQAAVPKKPQLRFEFRPKPPLANGDRPISIQVLGGKDEKQYDLAINYDGSASTLKAQTDPTGYYEFSVPATIFADRHKIVVHVEIIGEEHDGEWVLRAQRNAGLKVDPTKGFWKTLLGK